VKKIINFNSVKKKEDYIFKVSMAIREMLEEIYPSLVEEYIESNGEIEFDAIETMISEELERALKVDKLRELKTE